MVAFKNTVKTAMLLGALFGLLVWIGSYWGAEGMIMLGALGPVMNFGAWFFSGKIAVAARRGTEVTERSGRKQIVVVDYPPLAEVLAGIGCPVAVSVSVRCSTGTTPRMSLWTGRAQERSPGPKATSSLFSCRRTPPTGFPGRNPPAPRLAVQQTGL